MKNIYRYPLMVGLPGLFERNLSKTLIQSKKTQKLLTAVSIGVLEGMILCPFERLKTYFMTAQRQEGFKGYLQMSKGEVYKDIFRGLGPLTLRQVVIWIYFLQADLYVRQNLRIYYKVPDD